MVTINKQKPTMKPQTQTSKSSGVLGRIKPMGFNDNEGIKIVLYGSSGSGKTTLWSTFPAPILAVICSGGLKPGELRSLDTPENRKRINQVVLQESSELKTVVDALASGQIRYNTLVLDHVSGLQDLTLKEILGIDELPAQKGWGLASQQQWGQSTAQCKEYLRAMLNLDGNVVIIGQERVFGGSEEDGMSDIIRPTVGVAVTPSLAGWLAPACDYVLQCFKKPKMEEVVTTLAGKKHTTTKRGKGVQYCVRTEPHDVYQTKFRMPKGKPLPECIVDASYDKIMALIKQ